MDVIEELKFLGKFTQKNEVFVKIQKKNWGGGVGGGGLGGDGSGWGGSRWMWGKGVRWGGQVGGGSGWM